MAPDQYLLDRFHDEGVLLSDLLQDQAVVSYYQSGSGDRFCIFSDVVLSCLPMVLAPGFIPSHRAGYGVLVYSGMFGDSEYSIRC